MRYALLLRLSLRYGLRYGPLRRCRFCTILRYALRYACGMALSSRRHMTGTPASGVPLACAARRHCAHTRSHRFGRIHSFAKGQGFNKTAILRGYASPSTPALAPLWIPHPCGWSYQYNTPLFNAVCYITLSRYGPAVCPDFSRLAWCRGISNLDFPTLVYEQR